MSHHVIAGEGAIAPDILMPGDPLRAKYIAQHYLKDAVCYNNVRGMLGFTGSYKGKPVSVQGSGMGMPSMEIYATELLAEFGAKRILRTGTCGGMADNLSCRSLVMATAACTDSRLNRRRTPGDYAAAASFPLMHAAHHAARQLDISLAAGPVVSSDEFYMAHPDELDVWKQYGVLAVEMEACSLYTLCAKYGAQALALLTVSNHIYTGSELTAKEREQTLDDMIRLALETLLFVQAED